MSQNTEQLFTGVAYSYITSINEYLNLLNNTLFFSTEYFDEETFKVQEDLKEIFLSLPDLLSGASSEKEACAHKLLGFRPILETKFRVLNAYKRELHHLLALRQISDAHSDDYLENQGMDEEAIKAMDFTQLAADCTHFVFYDTKESTKQKHAALLLLSIPIKITKDNYLHYVKKSLYQIAIEDNVESATLLISILDQLFDGHTCPEYGEHFVDLVATLKELETLSDSDTFFEEVELLDETLNTLFKMLHNMYKMICSLGNLLLFDSLDFTTITQMHVTFFDFYHSLKKVLTSEEDRDLLLATLPERVAAIQSDLKKDLQKVSNSDELDPLFILIQTYLNMDIAQPFGFAIKKNNHYSEAVRTTFEGFIAALQTKLSKLPTVERKLRMQYLISSIPFIMSEQTFKAYIEQAFRNTSNPRNSLLAAMLLHSTLEQGGYFQGEEEEDSASDGYDYDTDDGYAFEHVKLHEHEEGNDCSCGHSHDHDSSHH